MKRLTRKNLEDFTGKYTIQVGSTGNLGLSIGIDGGKARL